jgi:hypothetical protein
MAGFGLNLKLVLYLQNQCLTASFGFLNPPHRQAAERQAVKKPSFLIIWQIIHTPKRHYSRSTASCFLGRKLSLIFNKVFKRSKIVRYTNKANFCFVGRVPFFEFGN